MCFAPRRVQPRSLHEIEQKNKSICPLRNDAVWRKWQSFVFVWGESWFPFPPLPSNDQGRINGSCLRKGGKRRSSARNFTAMTNDLRMLRRCLIGCHLRRVGRRKAKSGSDPRGGKREGREERRMMMRAKLIILGGCKRLRTFSLLSSSFSFLSFFFLPFLCPPLFPLRSRSRAAPWILTKGPKGTRVRFEAWLLHC